MGVGYGVWYRESPAAFGAFRSAKEIANPTCKSLILRPFGDLVKSLAGARELVRSGSPDLRRVRAIADWKRYIGAASRTNPPKFTINQMFELPAPNGISLERQHRLQYVNPIGSANLRGFRRVFS